MRRKRKEETCSSLVLLHPSLHPLTLSDQLHLIPSSLVYRLLPPGTVQKFACEYLVRKLVQTLGKLVKLRRSCICAAHTKDKLLFRKFVNSEVSTVDDSWQRCFV